MHNYPNQYHLPDHKKHMLDKRIKVELHYLETNHHQAAPLPKYKSNQLPVEGNNVYEVSSTIADELKKIKIVKKYGPFQKNCATHRVKVFNLDHNSTFTIYHLNSKQVIDAVNNSVNTNFKLHG